MVLACGVRAELVVYSMQEPRIRWKPSHVSLANGAVAAGHFVEIWFKCRVILGEKSGVKRE